MHDDRRSDAHAVLLPALPNLALDEGARRFLAGGGRSLLFGETRDEYRARAMSAERRAAESRERFAETVDEAARLAGDIIVAVDQEIGGICRLHSLVPSFFATDEWRRADTATIEAEAFALGRSAKRLGITCFLAPVLDVVKGVNPWLSGRTLSADPAEVARVSSAFIRGVQSAGVAAMAKHFPGHHNIPLDPAEHEAALVIGDGETLEAGFAPFADAIAHGVEVVIVGPAVGDAIDDRRPASLSPRVVGLLRRRFAFQGLVLSDDVDAPAPSKGRPAADVAIDALKAGCDLVLLAAGDHLDHVVETICRAVERGELSEDRLGEAASRVRSVASKFAPTRPPR